MCLCPRKTLLSPLYLFCKNGKSRNMGTLLLYSRKCLYTKRKDPSSSCSTKVHGLTEASFISWQIQFGPYCLKLVGQWYRKGNNYNLKTQNAILRSIFKMRGRMKQNEEDESKSIIGMHQSKRKSPSSFRYQGDFEVVWS